MCINICICIYIYIRICKERDRDVYSDTYILLASPNHCLGDWLRSGIICAGVQGRTHSRQRQLVAMWKLAMLMLDAVVGISTRF